MVVRELRTTLRALAKAPGFTLIVVVTLALGIGANTAIFSVLNAVLLRPLDYPEPDALVVLFERNREEGLEHQQVSGATFLDWRREAASFESMAAFQRFGHTYTDSDEPERIDSARVTPSLFAVVGVQPRLGRAFSQREELPGNERLAILSDGFWRRRRGADPDILDQTVMLDGEPYTVVGVMPPGFEFPPDEPDVELWTPLTLSLEELPSRPHRMYDAIARLSPEATLEAARDEMERVAAAIAVEHADSMAGWDVQVVPAHEEIVGDVRPTLLLLLGAVGLVLLIACANIGNLLLARSWGRRKEVALRATLGAGRWRLLWHSLAESLALALAGGSAGLLLAAGGIDSLVALMPAGTPRLRDIGLDASVLGFTLLVTLLSGLLFGLLPALRTMGPDIGEMIKEGAGSTGRGRRARRLLDAMVTVEVALALMLLVVAGLMLRSYAAMVRVDPGFRSEGVVVASLSLPEARYPEDHHQVRFVHDLVDRVRRVPGTRGAAIVTALPMSPVGTDFEMPFEIEGRDLGSDRPRASYRSVTPGYFDTMGIPLIRGRMLDDFDRQDSRQVMLINETMARRYFGGDDPVGELLGVPMAGQLEIVGVVGDVRHYGLQSDVVPEMFVPYQQLALRDMNLVIHTEDELEGVVRGLEDQLRALDPIQPISDLTTIERLLSASLARPRFTAALLAALAACALVLASVGIYGVVSYAVAQRTGEIGIRMALGAGAAATVRLIMQQTVAFVALGLAIGMALALWLARLLAGLLFGTGPADPATYLVVAVGLLGIAVVAGWIPARRASRVDPIATLRQE